MSSTFGCPHCGNTNRLDATFCISCGTYLKGLAAASLTPVADDQPEDDDSQPFFPATDPTSSQPWLRPDFDEEKVDDPPSAHMKQPWLRAREEDADAQITPTPSPQRLIGGLQGLIEPIDIEQNLRRSPMPAESHASVDDLPYEMHRTLRQVFATDVPILEEPASSAPQTFMSGELGLGLARRHWINGLLLIALIMALWSNRTPANVRPHAWPGVVEAYKTIDALPPDATVLINWAYDPTGAGEMDQVSLPVIEHLIEKNSRLLVVSQLPTGPATARRLITVAQQRASQTPANRQLGESLVEGGYLPGGIGSLPLLGQAPAQGIPVDIQGRSALNREAITSLEKNGPTLVLLVAFRSDEIQRWLEQVQPFNSTPVVAVTSAAVDAAIRPYVDSGQISGLVSGYSGAIAYRDLLADSVPAVEQEAQHRQITAQNWALAVLLLVIAVGNLAGLTERRES